MSALSPWISRRQEPARACSHSRCSRCIVAVYSRSSASWESSLCRRSDCSLASHLHAH
jgi:hypothetical protein